MLVDTIFDPFIITSHHVLYCLKRVASRVCRALGMGTTDSWVREPGIGAGSKLDALAKIASLEALEMRPRDGRPVATEGMRRALESRRGHALPRACGCRSDVAGFINAPGDDRPSR